MSREFDPNDDPDPRYSRSLGRGLAILGLFTPSRPVLGVAQIASLLGLTPATAHRYVTTLLELGYLERNRSRKYSLGLRVLDLGQSALGGTPLSASSWPVLEQLRTTTGYTASIGVLDGTDVVLIRRAVSTRRGNHLIPETAIGTRMPSHCTSLGKILLATMPDSDWRSRLGDEKLVKHGPGTITSKRRLEQQLRRILKRGYATSDQELWPEVLAVAVPVREEHGEVTAALSVTAHRSMTSLRALVKDTSAQLVGGASCLSERLGCRAPDRTAAG